jgi:lipopolysaccharide/colanic/teichoic acid biosynthesis glycosyltransferase
MVSATKSVAGAVTPARASRPLALSAWSCSRAKRVFDLACGLLALFVAVPVMIVAALLVWLTSPGPVLYRQRRWGIAGREFELLKFRSMVHNPRHAGPGLTPAGDSRITPVGRMLRKWKLDELPQLFNVIRGEMSLVGPRPDLSEYLGELPAWQRQVLRLRPGITGWATLHFRHEEELLAKAPSGMLHEFYRTVLLPQKIQLDLEYGTRATLWGDVAVLAKTFSAILH